MDPKSGTLSGTSESTVESGGGAADVEASWRAHCADLQQVSEKEDPRTPFPLETGPSNNPHLSQQV